MKSILVLFFSLTLFQNGVNNVDPATFKKMAEDKNAVVIDLRTADEINRKGKIAGARIIDWLSDSAQAVIKKLDRSKTYLVYCAGGGRSSDCAADMVTLGFKQVVNLTRGFDNWKNAGFPIETKK